MPTGSGRTPGAPEPAAARSAAGPLAAGDVLAGRYQLLSVVNTGPTATLWRASDQVLARQVAVKVVATPNKAGRESAEPFLAAAARAGGVSHPGLVRVYDAALDVRPGRGNDVAYVISEWVDGQPLDVHLTASGALAPPDAADFLRQAADALSAAHAVGVAHGRLHPRNVLVTESGRVRITDAAVGSVLSNEPVAEGTDPVAVRSDTRDLAAVLYALVTARWPTGATPQPAGSLAPAPLADGRPLAPRQVRAGVSRELDTLILGGLDPSRAPGLAPLTTPASLADGTDAAVAEAREQRASVRRATAPSRLRRLLPWIVALLFVAGVGLGGWLLGLRAISELPQRSKDLDALVNATTEKPSGAAAAVAFDLTRLPVRDFDPPPGDGQESPDQVHNAVDGDPSTAWHTSRYTTSAFGGLKPGVGLLVDLTKVATLSSVSVAFTTPGTTVELRVAPAPYETVPGDAANFQTVAVDRTGKDIVSLTPAAATRGRYWLVWITGLPKDGDGFRAGISELRFR